MESTPSRQSAFSTLFQDGSLTDGDYRHLIAALADAARVFGDHQGGLSAGDLRTRSLLLMAEKEAKRSQVESGSRNYRLKIATDT